MPATLTNPISIAVAHVSNVRHFIDVEGGIVTVTADQCDAQNNIVGPSITATMTIATWAAALIAATGAAKLRLYTVGLNALGLTASSVT